ncbi:hypothetical protein KP509_27G002600 [Ceratopteris richardii]|uniref:Retrotransposon gag domain-containing protein n=1 Tax=Ceratopteris richardii TaxID=49495 RepID=A0A8T2RFZ9_CERRI|nr:hypothetical protein KP509_27G002600 [Ceratopteris richardii]
MSEGSSSSRATQTQREERAQRRALERERRRWEPPGEWTSIGLKKSVKNVYSRRRVASQVRKFEGGILRPRALNFWDRSDIDITPLFEMAQRISVHLGDFTKFSGTWDEDLDSFIQLFEVTCEANDVVDQDQRLRIFPAILRDEAANWYGNLTPQERGTYQMLKEAFLAKFRRQGFQDRLAQQMDYLRQGVNESIDNYIQRMETLVRKMGANAPNDETLKRRFISGLRDPTAQQHISLTRPATLMDAKEQARLWEEVQLCQQRKMELLYEPMGSPGNIPMKDPGQGSPALTTPAFVAATSTPVEAKPALTEERILELVTQAIKAATMTQETYTVKPEGQGGDYPRGAVRDQRRDGPIQCWRCHGFGHTQSRCPNEKKPIDYTPLCRVATGKEKGPVGFSNYVDTQMHSTSRAQEHVPTIGVVFKTPNPQEGSSSSMHFVDAYEAKKPHKDPTVAVVTRTQEYSKKNPGGKGEEGSQEKIAEREEVENQVGGFAEQQELEDGEEIEILPPVTKEFVPGIAPFPERLRALKCRKERQSLEEVDIVKLLADTEVTLDIGTLLKCSPAYRKQFYNEYIKKPRKARDKNRQDKDVQGIIQSITTQIDSNAPAVTVEIKGYAVPGAQLDSGAAVNLMTEFMMKALGLNHMEETPMSLRMADQTQVKPAGLLKNVSTVVGGLEFKVDYLIVRPRTSEATFSILLGRPWLVQAECVHDWRTGFISIGPKSDRIQIQVSPPSSNKKKTIIVDEMEKKEKEKARHEIARARFSLNTDTYKNLLQDGFNLHLFKNQDTKMGEYQNPLLYNDDSDQELLGWLTHTSEFDCYMLSIDASKNKATQSLEKGTSREELKLELAPTMEVQRCGGDRNPGGSGPVVAHTGCMKLMNVGRFKDVKVKLMLSMEKREMLK